MAEVTKVSREEMDRLIAEAKERGQAVAEGAPPAPAPAPVQHRDPGVLGAMGEGVQDMATAGFADEVMGGVQASTPVGNDPRSWVERYVTERNAKRQAQGDALATEPIPYRVGQVAGGAMLGAALGPLLPAIGPAMGYARTAFQAAKGGAALGAAYGAGSSEANPVGSPGQFTWDMTKGAAGGAVAGAVVGPAGKAIGEAVWNPGILPAVRGASEEMMDASGRITMPLRVTPPVQLPPPPAPAAVPGAAAPVSGPSALPGAVPGATTPPAAPAAPPGPSYAPPRVVPSGPPTVVPPDSEAAVGGIAKFATGEVKPSPDAAFLMAKGVRLTRGQQDPRSTANQLEEALQSTAPHGQTIKAQRDQAARDWQSVVINTAKAPGEKPIQATTSIWDDLSLLYEGFNRQYSKFHGIPVADEGGEAVAEAALSAVKGVPGITEQERAAAMSFVQNQTTRFNKGGMEVGDLLRARSEIRDQLRKAVQSQNGDRAEAYEAAEEAMTAAIDGALGAKDRAVLRAIDAQYRKYKMVEWAAGSSGVSQNGFTPTQLSAGVRRGMSRGEFARGNSGDMWELAKAGREVFQSITPPTGARASVLNEFGNRSMEWAPDFIQKAVRNRVQGSLVTGANEAAAGAIEAPAGAMPFISEALTNRPQVFGQYATILRNAQAQGPDVLGVKHYLLWNKDPAYREMIRVAMGGGRR